MKRVDLLYILAFDQLKIMYMYWYSGPKVSST